MEGSSADEQGAGRLGGWWEPGACTWGAGKPVVFQLRVSCPVVPPLGSGSMRIRCTLRPAFILGVCREWSPKLPFAHALGLPSHTSASLSQMPPAHLHSLPFTSCLDGLGKQPWGPAEARPTGPAHPVISCEAAAFPWRLLHSPSALQLSCRLETLYCGPVALTSCGSLSSCSTSMAQI